MVPIGRATILRCLIIILENKKLYFIYLQNVENEDRNLLTDVGDFGFCSIKIVKIFFQSLLLHFISEVGTLRGMCGNGSTFCVCVF